MNTNIITSEERYTYERIHNAIVEEREEKSALIKQKIMGVIGLIILIAAPFLMDGDITFSVLILPVVLGMLLSSEVIIYH